MRFTQMAVGVLLAGMAGTSQAAAQDWAVTISARGGGYTGLTTLNPSETADFKKMGATYGGGVGFQLTPAVEFRADVTLAQTELQINDNPTGTKLNRVNYDASVQIQLPGAVVPYALIGVGGVTMHAEGTTGEDRTKPTAHLGLGVRYQVPGTNLALQAEGKAWRYSFPMFGAPLGGYTGTQTEVGLTGGITYLIPVRRSGF